MRLREFKHSYTARDRVPTLLLLERAAPRIHQSGDEAPPTPNLYLAVGSVHSVCARRTS
jgi:hypothetical protein